MKHRKPLFHSYSQLLGPAALFLGLCVVAFATGCSQGRPSDDRVMRCWEQGFQWRDGECRNVDGEIVEPAE